LKVLTTLASSHLSLGIASSLSSNHEVRLTDRNEVSTDIEFVRSSLDHGASTNDLVRGMDAIVHSGDIDPAASVSDQLDYQMRCTYNLLWAAAEEGVQRFVYLSSLLLMDGYGPDLAVTERWKTLPTTDVPVLCYHLGEMVCREFARERKIEIVILRLGEITPDTNAKPSPSALYMDDAADAVERALDAEHSGWLDIYHIQSAVPDARFLTGQPWWSADDVSPSFSLGYKPRVRN
jgi:nucleoside-diphosphate-sugar epimerase